MKKLQSSENIIFNKETFVTHSTAQMTDKYIKHPLEAVSVGDIVEVKVMSVDLAKKRIQLTMKNV